MPDRKERPNDRRETKDKSALRDAATVIVLRHRDGVPAVLMGQRGERAAFMPSKFVFPGGALDPGDSDVPLAAPIGRPCHERLAEHAPAGMQTGLAAAAIRELWEETGLVLGSEGAWPGEAPPDWRQFAATGHVPDASALRYVFRAVTPPGRPRRFDARFFVADSAAIRGDLDDFSRASTELSHLHWVPLGEARALDLPFITALVLDTVSKSLPCATPPAYVPFLRNRDEESLYLRLGGQVPVDAHL